MNGEEIARQVQEGLIDRKTLRAEFERRDGGFGTVLTKYHSPIATAFAQALDLEVPEQQLESPTICSCGVCDPCTERIERGFST